MNKNSSHTIPPWVKNVWFGTNDLVTIANKTIRPAAASDKLIKLNYNTDDIIALIQNAHKKGLADTKLFASMIPGNSVAVYCSNLWHFLKDNIRYQVDPVGDQWVKSPARVWYDKVCDCKSFAIFVGTVLANKGIPFKYRFVSFNPDNPMVTHVYVIVMLGSRDYLPMDVVYHSFNAEKPFYHKKDIIMAGLHYLAGIGKATEKIFNLGNKDISQITDGEMDLLIARDRMETEKALVEKIRGIGSIKAERYQDSIDMLDDAISAVNAYQTGKIGDIDTELALISNQASRGEYRMADQVAGIGTLPGRQAYRMKRRKQLQAKRSAIKRKLTPAQKANIWGIPELSGIGKTKGLLKKVAGKVKTATKKIAKGTAKVVKTAVKVVTAPARLVAKGILEITLPKASPFFLYLFINDQAILNKAPDKVRQKRKKAENVANFIVNGIGMKREHFMGIVRNGNLKHYGKQPEKVIDEMMKGKVSGIGVIGAAITAVTEIITKILQLVKKNKTKDLDISAADGPDASDWANLSSSEKSDLGNEIKSQADDSGTDGEGPYDTGGKSIWDSFGG